MADDARPITDLLRQLGQGDRGGLDRLVELLYTTLWRMCRFRLGRLPLGSLTPTALLNELYIDLADRFPDLANRKQFFAYAHEAIKHLAVSDLRRGDAKKRGGDREHVPLEGVDLADERDGMELVEVFEILARVEAQDPELAEIVKLRVFDGRTERETAELLGISRKKLQTQWAAGRGLLVHLLGADGRKTDGAL
jgi:RNA polymerase sigma factor (TIGR02999 family)